MKSKFTANMGLKLISLAFAFVLWLVVNNMENPTITETYVNIPVKLENTNLITDAGKVYEVLDGTDVIERVSVKAPKSVHNVLNASNIIATADVSELSSLDTISIEFSSSVYSNDIESIKGSIDTVKLNIENKRTKALSLKASVSGSVAEGYLVGEVTTDQNLVRISGPESLINQVAKATVDVDVTGFTSDIGTNLDIRLYDGEGNLIQDNRISQNIKSVGVKVGIYQTVEVPVTFGVSGTPATGYRVAAEPVGNIATVLVAGKSGALRNLTEIEIPEEAIDVTGQSSDYVTEVNIREYLPDNLFLADNTQAKIEVTVDIQQEVSRELKVQDGSLEAVNVPDGFKATLEKLGDNATITVIGLSADVAAIREAELKGRVDIQEWLDKEGIEKVSDGYYNIEADFELSDDVTLLEPFVILVHLSEKGE